MARFWPRRRRTTEYREEVAAPPPRRRPFWPWLLLLLLLVLGALGASWYFSQRDETVPAEDVPDVTGLTRPAAEQRLREREFEVEIERVVSRRAAGVVVDQRPEAGTLYGEGGIVVLSVARDPLRTEVPDVSGLPAQRALARLRGAELRPRAQEVQSREPEGTVLRQLPAAGEEVPVGSPAIVVVASGPELSTVPNVVGLTSGEASTRLTTAGFRTRVDRVPSTRPEGRVVAQNPRAGGRALQDTVVRINVSMGPGGATTTVTTETTGAQTAVPDTVGEDEATARATLEGAGFTVRVVDRPTTDSAQDGIVIQQRPAGGSTARSGSPVTIFVGRLS
jgi:beta-lactam-binding protein with PASTA domain